MYFSKIEKNVFVQIFPGILFPAGAEAGAAIMDRVKYEPIMAPTSTTCRQADQKPLQGKPKYAGEKTESENEVGANYESESEKEANWSTPTSTTCRQADQNSLQSAGEANIWREKGRVKVK